MTDDPNTTLSMWLHTRSMTPTSLAAELNINKDTVINLARGTAKQADLNVLRSISEYTRISVDDMVRLDDQAVPEPRPSLSGFAVVDEMLESISKHLHQDTEAEMGEWMAPDFLMSGAAYQRENKTRRSLTFEQMCQSNSNNHDKVINTILSATWINFNAQDMADCSTLSSFWSAVAVDEHGTVTKNYTHVYFKLAKTMNDLYKTGDTMEDGKIAESDERPAIRRWWWRVPAEMGQPV